MQLVWVESCTIWFSPTQFFCTPLVRDNLLVESPAVKGMMSVSFARAEELTCVMECYVACHVYFVDLED